MAGNVGNSAMISREAAFQDSLAQRARNKCPPKSALKARDNSARRRSSNIGNLGPQQPIGPRLEGKGWSLRLGVGQFCRLTGGQGFNQSRGRAKDGEGLARAGEPIFSDLID